MAFVHAEEEASNKINNNGSEFLYFGGGAQEAKHARANGKMCWRENGSGRRFFWARRNAMENISILPEFVNLERSEASTSRVSSI